MVRPRALAVLRLMKLTRAGSERLIFHGECFVIWRDERNSMSAGPAVLD